MTVDPYAEALRVLEIEAGWIRETAGLVEESFPRAVETIAAAPGKLVVCGVGKSGLVARKIAATMTSTGTPAHFLHAGEGAHGDLGILARGDVVLLLSKSGETPEMAALLPSFRRLSIPMIAITCAPDSVLGRAADVVLGLPEGQEACPYDLAPTASTTSMMALGDALAMALLRMHDFSPDDFARVHPGGVLGRKLLLRVSDLMVGPPLPVVPADSPLTEAVEAMTTHRGVCMTVDGEGRLEGIFVYGDLGRLMRDRADILNLRLSEVLVPDPLVCSPKDPAAVAVSRMEDAGVTSLIAVDGERIPVGIIYLHDVLRAGPA